MRPAGRAAEFRQRAVKALRPDAAKLLRTPRFRASAEQSGPVTIVAYGPVFSGAPLSEGEVTDTMVASALAQANGRAVTLRLNSPGGDAFAGIAIANLLRGYSGEVTAIVDGLAASAASVIAMGADKLLMGRGSQLMIHRAANVAIVMGNAEQMRAQLIEAAKMADRLDKLDEGMADIYSAKCGLATSETLALMAKETYMSAKQAVASKMADGLAEEEEAPPASEEGAEGEGEGAEDGEGESEEEPPASEDMPSEEEEAKAAKEICKALGVSSLSAAAVLVASMKSASASSERARLLASAKDRLTPAAAKSLANMPLAVVREVIASLPKLPKSTARAPRVERDGEGDIEFSGSAARQLGVDPAKVRAALAAQKGR